MRRKLFKCKYCGLTTNRLKGHIRSMHRKQYVMKQELFAGPGVCDNCNKEKDNVKLVQRGSEWKDICDKCEQAIAPYLKETKDVPAERIGGIRIN